MNNPRELILASSSKYRGQLLQRLGIPFTSHSPDVDESSLPGETAPEQALRLAQLKADGIAQRYPDALVIGSDQIALVNDTPLYKPGNHEKAKRQLAQISGQKVVFYTSLCVICKNQQQHWLDNIQYSVYIKDLDPLQIERYLNHEKPYDCAGSFKSEGYGITLFSAMQGDDPTALIGLPLIRLTQILNEAGMILP